MSSEEVSFGQFISHFFYENQTDCGVLAVKSIKSRIAKSVCNYKLLTYS